MPQRLYRDDRGRFISPRSPRARSIRGYETRRVRQAQRARSERSRKGWQTRWERAQRRPPVVERNGRFLDRYSRKYVSEDEKHRRNTGHKREQIIIKRAKKRKISKAEARKEFKQELRDVQEARRAFNRLPKGDPERKRLWKEEIRPHLKKIGSGPRIAKKR